MGTAVPRWSLGLALATLLLSPAQAHFLELLPSTDIVPLEGSREVKLRLAFTHPMERGPVMELAPPKEFGKLTPEGRVDLRSALVVEKREGKTTFALTHRLVAPGDQVFFAESIPYWEPAENKYIVQYAKVVVDFGLGSGWDQLVGFPVEIEPLVRPYGLWTGNQFRGIVRKDGKPLPFATLEVEWVNDGSITPPAEAFVTQVIKADGAGVFSYTMPRAGWWGFAALSESNTPLATPNGTEAPVEQGAIMWVKTVDMR